jgi:hypothetical protein
MLRLRNNDIRDVVGNRSFDRGRAYFNQGKVLSVAVRSSESFGETLQFELKSEVSGSGGHVYQQDIYVEQRGQDSEIDGHCSCPVGYNCKHIAAACLRFNETLSVGATSEPTLDACTHWLQKWQETTGQFVEEAISPGVEFIAYVLSPAAGKAGLQLDYRLTRILKKGGLGKGRTLRWDMLESRYHYHSREYLADIDSDIIKLLEVCRDTPWETPRIHGEVGAMALERILATGRCYWEDLTGAALQPGDPRELRCEWLPAGQGVRLELSVEPEGILVDTVPAVYLDPGDGVIGPVDTSFDARQLSLLQQLPVVPQELVEQFSIALRTTAPASLPTPVEVKVEVLKDAPAQPQLHLLGRVQASGQRVHFIRLSFNYAGHSVPAFAPSPIVTLQQGASLIELTRDEDAERAAIDRITALGFDARRLEESPDDLFLVSLGDSTLLDAWARWELFLSTTLPDLEEEGWLVSVDDSFQLDFLATDDDWEVEVDSGNDWFELRFDLSLGGGEQEKVPLLPLVVNLLQEYERGDWP